MNSRLEDIFFKSFFILLLLFTGVACENVNFGPNFTSFPQPEERIASGNALNTTLEVKMNTANITDLSTGAVTTINTSTYENMIPGPTLTLKPGDTLSFDLINNMPANPTGQRLGSFPKDQYTTNFHSHGWTVPPDGIADNVFRKMEPGTTNAVSIPLLNTQASGTFWYHPHKHGSVSFQFFGGQAGILNVEGGPDDLNTVPEINAGADLFMVFQGIRVSADGPVPFVTEAAQKFSSDAGMTNGLWANFQSTTLLTTLNGTINPTLFMKPGEVQRWRMLNAVSGLSLALTLQGHALNIVSIDGLNIPQMFPLAAGSPIIMGAGNRFDVLVQAGAAGTYLLQAINPTGPFSVSPQGIAPGNRAPRVGLDFPNPTFPITLATIVVTGNPVTMGLPTGPLPVPNGLRSRDFMLNSTPNVFLQVAFEICGKGGIQTAPANRLPSCGWFFELYNPAYWGGVPFDNLLMMRDAEDVGVPNVPPNVAVPRVDYLKEGLFTGMVPLFDDMTAGTLEEWTIINRSFSDHPFHIHINPFLLTHINGIPLPVPEWRDVVIVPSAAPQPIMGAAFPINSPMVTFGSVTFRTFFDAEITGPTVIHCHILNHEDVGMMQRIDINAP